MTMTSKIILASLASLTLAASAMPPTAGTTSELVTFERFTTSGVTNSGLADHEGKIIVISYFTPW